MQIKRLNPSTFDVFWNKGWEWHARFQRQSNGDLKQIGGRSMPTKLFRQFRSIVNKRGKQQHQLQATAKRDKV